MVDPEREPLAGLVEVDETSIPFRGKDEPVRPGRAHEGKLLIAGAVEIKGKGPGRVRLAVIEDYSATTLDAFVAGNWTSPLGVEGSLTNPVTPGVKSSSNTSKCSIIGSG